MVTRIRSTNVKQLLRSISIGFAAVFLLGIGFSPIATAAPASGQPTQQDFVSAAHEFGVPENVLLALSYNESHWQVSPGMSSDGGYGVMDLRAPVPTVISGRDGKQIAHPTKNSDSYYTLNEAATLLHVSVDTLKTDQQQNIRGAAAVLAQDAKQHNGGQLPTSVDDWYGAVAKYSGAVDSSTASSFASDVFATIKSGATASGQAINLPAAPSVQPNTDSVAKLGLNADTLNNSSHTNSLPECPSTLNCRFVPAAYTADDPNDPTNYGNYDFANRPKDMQIKYIYIHDGEGSYDSIIDHFQDPTAYVSAQYVVSTGGDITQMVTNEDVSWGIGNWNMNMHGINIEHAGFAAQGASWYTPAMYKASATLVRWLANKYHIPLDRQHILGHDNVMNGPAAGQANQHWDPGPFWNWNYYMDLVKGETPGQAAVDYTGNPASAHLKKGDVVKVSPNFATNQPTITDCQTGICVTLPKQGANFVYLHKQPNSSSPLLSDPYLYAAGLAGTTQDNDWGDKAPTGSKYVVADVQGDWTGIWYAGQVGWFYSPHGAGRTAHHSKSATLTPRPGLSSIPVYTNAYPEASAYTQPIPVQPQGSAYTMPAGQMYTTTGEAVKSDYFYDWTWNYSTPDDHMIVRGNQTYYQITFNHRVGFVKAGDVVVNHR